MAARRSREKKKKRAKVDEGMAHIHSTFNNTIITITNLNGEVLCWSSAGAVGFKGTKKGTPFAAQKVAEDAIRSAVARAAVLEKIEVKEVDITKKTLIIGGGVAGLTAAVDLAEQGFEVFLVEKRPTIGGKMATLDRTFPTDDCSI